MGSQQYHELTIPSCLLKAKQAEDSIVAAAIQAGFDEDSIFALRLAIEEAFSNAVRHGNRGAADKTVRVRYQATPDRVDIYISDQGKGFDLADVSDPTTPENREIPTGRGIMLMRAYMNLVEYNEIGNTVHLVKLNKAG